MPSQSRDNDLTRIPGVGPKLAMALEELGCRCVVDVAGRDPQQMYDELCRLRGEHIDRCVLYVFRCAVYYAERKRHDPKLLQWWNWSDEKMPGRRRSSKK